MNLTQAKTFNPATAVMSFSPPDSRSCRDRPLAALERLAILGRYDIGEPVFRCNDSTEHWYRLVSGAARLGAVSGDGRRHIVDFVFPGDFFGFGGFGSRQFCVEAMVAGTVVARYPCSSAERLADADPQTARNIRKAAFQSIARMQRRMVMLGQTSALEKVSAFLLEMSDRSHHCASSAVFLPMSRYDIADYLAIAVETVSRTLTELRIRQTIEFRGVRHVCIRNRSALAALASGLSVS
jgi:CRP/FNR family transcriptional regulator, nitrogen fixation regulation protein